jgi:hypothetical protein
MAYDGLGQVAPENGNLVLANAERAYAYWYPLAAPVAVAAPDSNFCPNYSSTLLPLDDGRAALEIASRWDGNAYRSYFARGPLLGTSDATGVTDGAVYRLVNIESGMCLDVAGGSRAPGGSVPQWTCNDEAPQNWNLQRSADGSFTLTSANSGLCCDARRLANAGLGGAIGRSLPRSRGARLLSGEHCRCVLRALRVREHALACALCVHCVL